MEKNEKTTTTEKEVTSEKEAAEKEAASTASENKKSNKRKWLKIGGAILAGVGAFGAGFGAGYMLSNNHQNHAANQSSAAESEPVGGVAIEPI